MKRALITAGRIAALPTLALVVALAVLPGRAELAARVWLLVLLAAVAVAAIQALRGAFPREASIFEQPPRRETGQTARLPSLERAEREVALATASAHDVHFRLRPTLRAVAAELLAARRGVGLDHSPVRAHELLGDETWELVRADREPPRDPRGAGLTPDELERVVRALEAI